jgi:hypothetical protein
MTTLFDEDAINQAMLHRTMAEADRDPTFVKALVDVGLIMHSSFEQPSTNRRTIAAAKKRVHKFCKAARREIERQMASGTLDLSLPKEAILMGGLSLREKFGDELRPAIDQLIEMAKEALSVAGGINPLLIIETKADGLIMFELPTDKKQRDLLMGDAMADVLCKFEATAYAYIHDAWVSQTDGSLPTCAPRDDPQRKEALVASLTTKTSEETWYVEYERTPSGLVFEAVDIHPSTSRYGNLLLRERAH